MKFELYVEQDEKKLRCGYTTGSACAMGAHACALALLKNEIASEVSITVPKGVCVTADVEVFVEKDYAVCRVVKDGGDDIDATHGAVISTKVWLLPEDKKVVIEGKEGVGRVTKPGLDRPVGEAAINSIPRNMIKKELASVAESANYSGGFYVEISVLNGEEIAKKTFNEGLGIVGGISILGTSGIVMPMSVDAIKKTISTELNMHSASGEKHIIITPGNYGEHFLNGNGMDKTLPVVKCSNFIGDTLKMAQSKCFSSVLLVGHIGKISKIAAGVLNTHSKYADARAEVFVAHAAMAGCSASVAKELYNSMTADGCIEILKREGIFETAIESLICSVQKNIDKITGIKVGVYTFSNVYGEIAISDVGREIIKERFNLDER